MDTPAPSPPPLPSPAATASSGSSPGARQWAWLGVAVLILIAIDLGTKALAFRYLAGQPVAVPYEAVMEIMRADARELYRLIPPHEPVTVIPRVLDFTLVLNPGAVFGVGPGQRGFFMVFTLAALAFSALIFWKWTGPRDRLAHAAIALIVAGGLGNLYDRLVHGCVRDFLHPLPGVKFPFGWSPWGSSGAVWPWVSNVADAFLIVGIIVLAWHLWRVDAKAARRTP
jgi:signal peptidase II